MGNQYYGGDSSTVSQDIASDVISITSTDESFAALKSDGSVVSWGSYIDQSGVASELSSGVTNVFSAYNCFAALKTDGSVVVWNGGACSDTSNVTSEITSGVIEIYSTKEAHSGAFAAIKSDGSVVTWGQPNHGADSSSINWQDYDEILSVSSTKRAFAAIVSV